MISRILTAVLLAGLFASAAGQTLAVLTHDSFAVSDEVIAAFTAETGIAVEFIPAGDAGEVVNRAILTRGRPLADVLFGIDNNLLARAEGEGVFEPYRSPLLDRVALDYRLPGDLVTPVDVGFVNFNLDRTFFSARGLPLPGDIVELTDSAYRGLTVVQNPASSSPGLAFMLATIQRFGEGVPGDWLDFWAALRDNDLQVSEGWTEAYYTAFSRYGGDRPVVLSYATSPAAEVIFAEDRLEEAPTLNLFCLRCAYLQIEAAGILAGTSRRAEAEAFIDFLLSRLFQQDIPLAMFVYPVVEGTPLPPEFERFGRPPEGDQIALLAPATVAEQQRRWLRQWTEVVLQGRDPETVR